MTTTEPITDLDAAYSDPGAEPTSWPTALKVLTAAELSWLTTVRPDGRPHVTPLITVCDNGIVYFCTGPHERKALNLATNPHVVLTTGTNALHEGLDVVVEADAVRVTDDAVLRRLADIWVAKYSEEWRFEVRDGAFRQPGTTDEAWVFAVTPTTVFGFAKSPYGQTRWRFVRPGGSDVTGELGHP